MTNSAGMFLRPPQRSQVRPRWLKSIGVFNGQGEVEQLKLFPSQVEPPADAPQVARVLVHRVRLERTRQFPYVRSGR